MALPSLKFPKIIARALSDIDRERQLLPKLEKAPEVPEEESLFKSLAKLVLPRSLEVKFGLTEPNIQETMWEQEGARGSYYRQKRFNERYEAEITQAPTIPKEYKEPETLFGQIYEGAKSGYLSTIKPTIGYLAESFGREMGSPQMMKWGEESADRATIEVLKHPELLAPENMKPFFKGGIIDQRWYGRVIGETSAFIGTVFGATLFGGLLGGPTGAAIGAYGSVYAIEKANSYKDFIDAGIPPDEASLYSNIYGTISSAIENAFGIAPAKIGRYIFTRQLREVPMKSFQAFLKRELPKVGFKILKTSFEEGAEEVAQELTSNLIKKYYDIEGQKLGENLAESFAAGFFASIPFGAARVKGVQVPGLTIEEVGKPAEIPKEIESVNVYEEKLIEGAKEKLIIVSVKKARFKGEDVWKIKYQAKAITPEKKVTKAKDEFKVGEIIDTLGKTNMVGNITIRKVEGNSLYFTDSEGTDYSRIARSTVRNFIKEGVWKRVEAMIPEVKPLVGIEKEITKEITKKRFTVAQRLEQKEKAEVRLTKERIESIARGARKGVVITKRGIKEIQTQLLDILNKSELSLSDKAKFRATIKNIQTAEQLQKELPEFQERIVRLLEAEDVRTLKSQIKGVLAKTKVRMQAGKPVGKFTPIVQKVLDTAREAMKLNEKESEARIIENLDKYKEKTMPVEVAVENRILDMNSQGPVGLRELLKTVTEIRETGEMAKALKDFNIQEELDREKNYLIEVVTDYKGIAKGRQTTGREKADFKKRAKQSLMTLGQSFVLSWRGLMNVLDWHTRVDKKTLADKYSVLDQESKYKELQEEYINDFNQMFADIYNIPMETTKDKVMLPIKINGEIAKLKEVVIVGTFKNSIGQKLEIKLTRDEMIKRYMEFQDETLYDSYREGNNYTEEIRDAIRAKLTNQEKSLAGEQMILYRKQYDKINPIYRKMYGVDLPFNEFYSPIIREGYKIDLKEGFQVFLDEITIRKAVTSKSFITRIRNALPIARQGSLEALDRHITQTNYFIAWAEKIRQLSNIFADPGLREVITEEFGGSFLKQIMNTVEDLAYNRRIRGTSFRPVNWARTRFTMGVLMLKPALAIKQMVSTMAYLEKLDPIEFTVGILDFWRSPIKNYQIMAKESTFIRTRGKGGEIERDIRAAMKTSVYKRFGKVKSFWNIAMMNIRIGDKGAIITGSWAVRRAGLKKGMNLTETIREYEEFSSETQQSADISQLSAFQKAGGGWQLFSMFKSAQRQYLAKEVNAVKSLFQKGGASPKNITKVARIMAIYHFLLPMLFQFIVNFGGFDDDDKKEYLRAGIWGSLNGWFIAGDVIDGIIRAALGLRSWPMEVPILTIKNDIEQAIKKVDFDDITAEDMKDALFELSDAGESLGIPVRYIKNFSMGLQEIVEGDIHKGIGLLLGWSEYYLKEKKGKVPAGIKTEGLKMPSLKFKKPGGLPSLKFPKIK